MRAHTQLLMAHLMSHIMIKGNVTKNYEIVSASSFFFLESNEDCFSNEKQRNNIERNNDEVRTKTP